MRLRSEKKDFSKSSILCSVVLHIMVLGVGFFSFSGFNKPNTVFMDVEIAGEGELREALSENFEPRPKEPEPKAIDQKPELIKQPAKSEGEKECKPQKPQSDAEDSIDNDAKSNDDKSVEEKVDQSNEKDSVPQLPKPKPQKPKKDKPKPKPKPKPAKKKKALLDVIKQVEKREKKKQGIKKLHEIANASSQSKEDDDFDKMLNDELKEIRKNTGKGKSGDGAGSSGVGNGLSEGDFDIISSQIYPHWNVSGGVKDAENIIIDVRVKLTETGEVIPSSIEILNKKRYAEDYVFKAAADSARHAILEASPLKIPRDKIEMFRNFVVRFNLKEALGG